MFSSVVLPRPIGKLLAGRSDSWLTGVAGWARHVLSGDADAEALAPLRRRLATEAVELQVLSSQLPYDTSPLALSARPFAALRQRALLLLPVLSGLADRVRGLAAAGALGAPERALMGEVSTWLDAPDAPDSAEAAERLRARIASARPDLQDRLGWEALLLSSLLSRLGETVDIVDDVRRLRTTLRRGRGRLPAGLRVSDAQAVGSAFHLDPGMALLSALCCVLTVLLLSAFWIASAWPAGGSAVVLAAVGCSFFANQDDPVPAIRQFLYCSVLAIGIDVVLLFAVLPQATTFEMLILALGAVFIPAGLLITRPRTAIAGLSITAIGGTLLAIQGTFSADFASFLEGGIAYVLAFAVCAAVTAVVRSVGAEWSARRLLRAGWSELAGLATGRASRAEFAARMLDRLGLLVPRLAAAGAGTDLAATDVLVDLRVGLGVLALREELPGLPAATRRAALAVRDGVGAHYASLAARRAPAAPPDELRRAIDDAIAVVIEARLADEARLVQVLVGLRRCLFAGAPDFLARTPARALLQAAE